MSNWLRKHIAISVIDKEENKRAEKLANKCFVYFGLKKIKSILLYIRNCRLRGTEKQGLEFPNPPYPHIGAFHLNFLQFVKYCFANLY